jgi:hypothetical protein
MKKVLFLLLVVSLSFAANAQQPQGKGGGRGPGGQGKLGRGQGREKIEMYKIQFFTQKLSLTTAEAELFWPAYEAQRKVMKDIIETKSNDEIQMQEAILNARKKYKTDLKPILKSEERINEALKLEREFLRKIRSEMNRRKGFRS